MRNFLKGLVGDSINLLLKAAAFNFKRVMNLWRLEAISCWQLLFLIIRTVQEIFEKNGGVRGRFTVYVFSPL